jgi:DNA-binding NarL/FixJ family response regulator
MGDTAPAEQLYEAAAARAQDDGAFALLWQIHAGICALHDRSGSREKARQAYETALRTMGRLAERAPSAMREAFRAAAQATLPTLRPPTARQAARQAFGGLTEREREVAGLVAAGRSNAAIGETLVISERTVETHVTSILTKLGYSSRAQIAIWAAERGLSR